MVALARFFLMQNGENQSIKSRQYPSRYTTFLWIEFLKMPINTKGKHDKKLEGLRGLCAITVCYAHLFTFNFFGSKSITLSTFWSQLHFAHIAVLIFFILSGYVIGVTYSETHFNISSVILYLKKRTIRLYPIYLIAVLISILLYNKGFDRLEILGNLIFLQELYVKTISTNVVLWSLSYEVVYYLLFLLIWAFKNTKYCLPLFLTIAIFIGIFLNRDYPTLSSIGVGWTFWLSGLFIAWNLKACSSRDTSRALLSYLFIMLASYSLEIGIFNLELLGHHSISKHNVTLPDIFYLPICALIICELTHREVPYIRYLRLICFLLPIFQILILIYFKHDIYSKSNWFFGCIYTFMSLIFLLKKSNIYILENFSYTGKISYALYVFHFPIAYLLSQILSVYFMGYGLFFTGISAWMIVTLSFSIFMELIYQPTFKRILSRHITS